MKYKWIYKASFQIIDGEKIYTYYNKLEWEKLKKKMILVKA